MEEQAEYGYRRRLGNGPRLAIVVPCYNEGEMLPLSNMGMLRILREMVKRGMVASDSCLFYVDDGSDDITWSLIEKYSEQDECVGGMRLSCNMGHQNALMAGLEAVAERVDIVVTIDADLQDDIEAIPRMVRSFKEGNDIVYGVRSRRDTDSWFKRSSALAYYKTLHWLGVKTVYNHSDFRLMSARVVMEILRYGERNLFLRGILPLVGYKSDYVYYERKRREAGESKYPLMKRVNFAIDGITSFSVRPVRMVFVAGMIFMLTALAILIYSLIRYFGGHTIAGWTSLMLSIWFCTGILLMALGIIGEYVGKIYIEVKNRPRYSVSDIRYPRSAR